MYQGGKTPFGTFSLFNGSPYPVTIVSTRYGGCYEGGKYAAFPTDPQDIPEGWDGGDCECMEWWCERSEWPIGLGSTPDDAVANLVLQLKQHICE